MRIAVICALSSELKMIVDRMDNCEVEKFHHNEIFKGKIGENQVFATVCSIGKVNSAIKTQLIISKYNAEFVINTGIAGSLDNTAKHLGVVVSDKLFYHDFDLDLFERFFPNQRFFQGDVRMRELFLQSNVDSKDDIVVGNIATGDVFVQDSKTKDFIKSLINPICVEMEGAAIAHTAYVNDIPCLVLRCISDMADENANQTYDDFEVIASEKVANMVIKFIEKI